MRRAHHFVFLFCSCAFVSAVTTAGCGSGTASGTCPPGDVCEAACPEGEICIPADGGGDGSGGGGGGGDGSSTTGGDSGGGTLPAGCTDAGPADPNPTCNACAYANCCKQVDDCAADPSCTGLDNCEAACDPNDIQCLLLCQDEYDTTTATAVGACIQQHCAVQCPAPDGGQFTIDAF
jgi:hypothetical protein